MSSTFPRFEQSDFRERFDVVLQGRAVNPWAESVGINRSTAQRLSTGQFPDPEKLIRACRVERISLTWLLDGQGTPFLVYPAESDRAGAEQLRMRLRDEAGQRVVLAHSKVGYCVLLLQLVEVQAANQPIYSYTSIDVIGGGALGPETALAAMESDPDLGQGSSLQSVEMSTGDWSRLATGRMGNVALIGWSRARGGLLDTATDVFQAKHAIAEPTAAYAGLTPDESEVLAIFRSLAPEERTLILRQLRALRR